ncbi:MAG TPA: hypothetical protein VK660_07650 [Xanthomonadaceae bacterium]|jgi:hypothetical protein|nr:hypothetical protein [Xanthomonadaceae bacterium]
MKRLFAFALLSLLATIVLGGCQHKDQVIKPVGSAAAAATTDCSGDRCSS